MTEKKIPPKIPRASIEFELTYEAIDFINAMSEQMRLSPDTIVEQALLEKAEREGVVEGVRAREDLREAFRRMGKREEANIPWSELRSGVPPQGQYKIEFKAAASTEWKRLPLNIRMDLTKTIDGLANNPEPAEATELQGFGSLFRVRCGGYHITYVVQSETITVLIVKSGKRG